MSNFSRNPEKVYSLDGEVYRTYEEIQEEIYELGAPKDVIVMEGLSDIARHSNFISASRIVEDMSEYVYDNYGEFADGYLHDVYKKQIDDLNNLLVAWFNKNISQPTFFKVFDVKESEEDFTDD